MTGRTKDHHALAGWTDSPAIGQVLVIETLVRREEHAPEPIMRKSFTAHQAKIEVPEVCVKKNEFEKIHGQIYRSTRTGTKGMQR